MLKASAKIVPPLLSEFHKGQLGRILVVGGSQDYTGAPFFAAMASALVGADMSHVLCSKGAAPTIKGYSPNLMVHPYLHNEGDSSPLNDNIDSLLSRMHVLLIGPGLGRDEKMLDQVVQIISLAKARKLPLVIDADGLWLVHLRPDLIKDYPARTVLTPNVIEFARLGKALGVDEKLSDEEKARKIATDLRSVVLLKGPADIVSNGTDTVSSEAKGSPRRVSGQGDTLSGALATFVAWCAAYENKLWDVEPIPSDAPQDIYVLAAWAASAVARTASRTAYEKHGRATVTTDVNGSVGIAFAKLFP